MRNNQGKMGKATRARQRKGGKRRAGKEERVFIQLAAMLGGWGEERRSVGVGGGGWCERCGAVLFEYLTSPSGFKRSFGPKARRRFTNVTRDCPRMHILVPTPLNQKSLTIVENTRPSPHAEE